MKKAAEVDVAVLVVNAEVDEASELVDFFGRGNGGPGAVVLVPESSDEGASDMSADEVLQKPFTDQQISLAVRRCVSAAQPGPTEVSGDEDVLLTSEDIFGDVMLELEDAFSQATGKGAKSVERAAPVEAAAEAPAEEPAAPAGAAEEAAAVSSVEEDEEAVADEDIEVEDEAEEPEADQPAAEEEAEEEEGELEEAAEVEVEEPEVIEVEEEPEVEEVEEEPEVEEVEEEPEAVEVEEGEDDEVVAGAASLLDQELGSLRALKVQIDDEFTRPAEVTDAEIDAMVRSAIIGPAEAAKEPAPGVEPESAEAQSEAALEFEGTASDDDVEETDAPAARQRPNVKLITALLLLLLIALLIFFFSRSAGGEAGSPAAAPAVSGSVGTASSELEVDEAAGAQSPDDAAEQ